MDSEARADEGVDPTAVVGRRITGWLVDVALITGAAVVVLLLLGDSFERPGSETDLELRRFGDDTAVFFRSTVAVVHLWEWLVAGGVALVVALVVWVLLPGRRGWTPGLLAAELRLVDRDGAVPGLGRALVRSLAWVVDALPGVPVVGWIAMRTGRHHQRIGDHLARTYVVDRAFAGRSPTDLTTADGSPGPRLAPAPEEEAPEPSGAAAETATVRRGPHGTAADATADATDGDEEPPVAAPDEPSPPEAEAEADVWAPGDDDAPGAREPADKTPSGPPPGVEPDHPVWDPERSDYVMWHSGTGRWVVYDDDAGRWVAAD